MQAQQVRTTNQTINYTQSLAAVQMLLHAGLGSIAYLRNLLPDDNFSPCHFTSAEDFSNKNPSFELSPQESSDARKTKNSLSIMRIMRNLSSEADRLLNYLEFGIFDALEKCYLRSFIFAIYLDSKDPTNIVEAYTFNFRYHTVPGSKTPLPVMTLGRQTKDRDDPVAQAIKNGKAPTLKEVRASVKTLVKTLINAMHSMDSLPRRRYATFKVYYTEETPMDYEPPHFHSGDVEKDKWYFMTHDFDEVPDRYNIGKLATGHHTVKLTVTSIASFIPPPLTQDKDTSTMTPLQEVNLSMREAENQLEDAEKRALVYSADQEVDLDTDADAESEDDLGYVRQADGVYAPAGMPVPIGIRGEEGAINPIPVESTIEEAQFDGVSEKIVTNLQDMAPVEAQATELEETQPLFETPKRKTSTLPASSAPAESQSTPTWPRGLDPEMLENMSIGGTDNRDCEMLDLETQRPVDSSMESIESFERTPTADPEPIERTSSTVAIIQDKGLDCECTIEMDDESCFCEGGCGRWFHVWCMGFHSAKDPRMPKKFICFDCRAKASVDWDFIKMSIYPRTLEKFCELTIFRRAIKVAEQTRNFLATEFYRAYADARQINVGTGCTAVLGAQLVKQLEEQEFIHKETAMTPDQQKTGKGKGKTKARPKRNIQKLRYVFNFSIQSKPQYMDYFKPDDRSVENRLLGISMMVPKRPVEETQTQAETQPLAPPNKGSKRGSFEVEVEEDERPLKKVKISVAMAVDLAE
ncbi:HORMA domain-containing protein [Crepidotus variabilis]|uniref:HORMA domain-containing protein n=1 Tax=Crepidotus variabilis TaxID=179855 RepID=A0A9P6ECJ8_9AGAR|nr:HORMA domain-containing protein [Crepidotus variabilis]